MIFTRDFATRENQWHLTRDKKKSLLTVKHALFFISATIIGICLIFYFFKNGFGLAHLFQVSRKEPISFIVVKIALPLTVR